MMCFHFLMICEQRLLKFLTRFYKNLVAIYPIFPVVYLFI